MIKVPNLDTMYNAVCKYVKKHQGEKGYIDVQPYQENAGDTIYTYVFEDFSGTNEEQIVYGVRWNEEVKDLEICFEPYMRTYKLVYGEDNFLGKCDEEVANADWYSVKWSDVLYVPTIFNLAEFIEEYGE